MDDAPGLIWDACCLLNLMALGDPEGVLSALGCPSYVVREVRFGEVLYLRPLPEENAPAGTLVRVDVGTLIDAGCLEEVSLDNAGEVGTFITLAGQVDDGEARSAAIAVHRGLWLVTDDRAALRLVGSLQPPVQALTTPEWLKRWSETGGVTHATVSEALHLVEQKARYTPRVTHPLKKWWDRRSGR